MPWDSGSSKTGRSHPRVARQHSKLVSMTRRASAAANSAQAFCGSIPCAIIAVIAVMGSAMLRIAPPSVNSRV